MIIWELHLNSYPTDEEIESNSKRELEGTSNKIFPKIIFKRRLREEKMTSLRVAWSVEKSGMNPRLLWIKPRHLPSYYTHGSVQLGEFQSFYFVKHYFHWFDILFKENYFTSLPCFQSGKYMIDFWTLC